MKDKCRNTKKRLFLSLFILAQVLVFVANACFTMPYDMGGWVKWLMQYITVETMLKPLLIVIPIAIFILFDLSLALVGSIVLTPPKEVRFQTQLEFVFWGNVLLLFGDDRRFFLSYQMLHGLCSIRGICFLLLWIPVSLLLAVFVKKIWWQKAAVTGGLLLSGVMLYCKVTGFLSLPAKGLYTILYYVVLFGIVILSDRLEKKRQMTFCIGIFVVICFCGQFVFSQGTHMHLWHRDEKLLKIIELFSVIEEKEGEKLPMIAGNNGGLKRIMAYNTDIEIPYDPNEMAAGKWSRQQYGDSMITMYNAAAFGEYGLGGLIAYANQKGCRYILLADEESWLANNMAAGGYTLLYETEDMMLFYK